MRTSHIQRGTAVPRRRSVATALALVLAFVAASITLVSSPVFAAAVAIPGNLSGTVGNGQVALTWTQSGTAVLCNKIQAYNSTGGAPTGVTSTNPVSVVSAITSYTFTGLTNGTSYTFKVVAFSDTACSKGTQTSALSAVYTPAAQVPGAPAVTSITGSSSTSLSVAFTAPTDDGGAAISNYKYSTDGGSSWTTRSPTSTASPISIGSLASNTAFSVQIRAVNSVGDGTATSSTTGTTLPGAPSGFTLSKVNGDGTRLSGSFTVPTGAVTITGYKYRINSGAWTSLSPSISSGTGTFTLTGLTANTSYTVDLLATNSAGDGASAAASNTTVVTAPTSPVASSVAGDATKLSVAFTAPTGTTTGYEFSTDNGSTWSAATGTSSPITLTGLTANTAYTQLKIRAVNGSSKGEASAAFLGTTVLATPTSPVASGVTGDGTQLSVALTAPSGTITKFQFSTDDGSTWSDATGTSSPISLTGLTSNTVYSQLKVRAISAAGAGTSSATFSGITVPGAPASLAVASVSTTSSSLTLAFTAPTGAGTITGYEYQLNGGTWTALTAGQVSALSFTLTGLSSNTANTVALRALNAGGTGVSTQVSGTTLPAAPTAFTVAPVDGDSTQASVSFTVPSGSVTITGYEYRVGSGSWTSLSPSISNGTGTFTITGLSANTNYTVQLRASNSAGTGDTAQASADTALAAPTDISVAGVEGDGTKLTITFTEPAGSATAYQFSKDGGSTWSTAVETTSPITITGLTPGTLNTELRIRAAKGLVRGSPTANVSGTTTPGGPTITSIGAATDTSFEVSFTLSADPITPTGLQYSTNGGTTWSSAAATTSPLTITGLDAGTAYSVRLRAVNASGAGTASAAASAATIPAAPTNPVATPVAGSPTTLSVAFTAPAGTITGYQYSKDGGSTWTTAAQTTSPITVSNLSANTTYSQLRIRAVTSGGEGAATASFQGITVPGAPGIGDIHSETSTSFVVPFTPYSGGTESIVRHEYSIHPDEWFTIAADDVTAGSFTVTGLETNTFHTVHVRAVSASGAGAPSAGAEATTTPGAPTGLAATGVDGNGTRLSVALTAPGGEAAITGYEYQVDGGNWVLATQTTSPITVTGLSSNTTYSLKVRALNHAGVGAETASFSGTTVLAAPTSLSASPIDGSGTTASLSFTAPTGSPTGYEYSINGGTSWTAASETSSPITISGLTANTTNSQIEVRAVGAAGKGEASSSTTVTPVAGAPTSVSVSGVSGTPGSLRVTFTAPSGTGTVTDYEYTLNGGAWTSASAAASPIVITGLPGNTGYTVTLRAVTAAGKGVASGSASGATVPTSPTIDSVVETASSFVVTFTAPSGGDATITGYQYSHDSGATWEDLTSAEVSAGSYTVTDLASNTSYPVWLRAVNSGGGGSYASAAAVTLPGAPTITGVSGTTENGFTVAFTAVSGAATIDRYEYSIDSGSSWSQLSSAEVTAGSFAVAALTANTAYTVTMRAVNVSGNGTQASTNATTLAQAPVVTSALGLAAEPTKLSVAFTQPAGGGATITAYQYSTDGTTWTSITGTTSPLTLTGLTANTVYTTLRLRAVNAGGNGTASNEFSGTTTAGSPTITGFSSITETSFAIGFTGPSGSAITTYEYSIDGGSTWVDALTTSSPIAVSGLSANTAYSVKLRAVTLTVAGVASSASIGTTVTAAPTSVTASPVASTPTQLSVAFTAPTGGGATITRYEFSVDGGTNWSTATGTSSPVTLTGLTGSTGYTQLQLRAVNAGGNGSATSDFSGNTVPAAPTSPSAAAVDGSSTSLRVSFTPVAGGGLSITGYEFQRDGSATWFAATTVTSSSIDLTGLSANTVYTALKIRAVSADGAGAATAAFSGSTVLAAPTSPVASSVTGSSSQLSVAFTAPSGTVTGYEFSTDGGSTWASATGTASPVTLTGLSANTAYLRLQLRAVNGTGKGSATADFSGTTVPAAPTIDSITAASSSSLTVNFSAPIAPQNTEPATITNYEYSTDGGTTWKARNTTGTSSPLTITLTSTASSALASNTSYNVKIRAVNAGGSGVASGTTAAFTLAAAPTSPIASAVTGDSTRLSVAFTAPGGAGTITKYEFSTDGGSTWATATGTTSPVVLTGLTPNTTYAALQLRAVTAAGNGAATSSFSGTTVPAAPSITSITAASTTSLTVNFTAPSNGASTSPATITNYEYSTDGGTTWRARNTTGTVNPITITLASATGSALASNTSYNVKIRAVNAGGSGDASATTAGLTLSAAPTVPVASAVTGQPTQLSVAFTAPTGVGTITGYEFSKDGGSTWAAATGTSSPITLTGLTANTTYTTLLQIRAVTAAGSGSASASFTGTTVPAAPTITGITSSATTSISVAFTAPTGTITTYEYSTDGGTTWRARGTGTTASPIAITVTSTAGTALTANMAYPVQIRALSAAGTGAASSTTTGTTIPATPTVSTLAAVTGDGTRGTFTLTSAAAGTATITGYQFSIDGGTTPQSATVVNSTTITVTGLTGNTSYSAGSKVLLRAVNSAGASAWTSGTNLTTTPAAPTPGAVSAVTATSFSIAVTNSTGGGASNTTNYEYSTDGGTTWRARNTTGTTSPISITLASDTGLALASNTTYSVRLRAVSSIGSGSASSATSVTTLADAPTNVVASGVAGASTSLSVSFTATGSATVTRYEYSTDGTNWSTATGTSSPITLTGFTANTLVSSLRIRLVNAAGNGATSALFNGTTVPGAPTAFTVSPVDGDGTRLSGSFTVPSGSVAITGYEYRLGSGSWTSMSPTVTSGTGTFTITGLTANTAYTVGLRATNSGGAGESGSASNTTSLAAPSGVSAASVVGDGTKVTVSFTAPAGSPTGYQFSKDGGATWTTATETSSPLTITGLTPGTSYSSLQIRAANGAVRGSPTANFSATTTPGSPTITSISNATDSSFQVAFTLPSDTVAMTGIQYSIDGGSWVSRDPQSTSSPLTISGLSSGVAYSVRLRVVNSEGGGSASAAVTGATIPAAPANPVASAVDGSASTLSVSFTAPVGTITSYEFSTDGGTNWSTATGSSSPVTITGLSANTTYTQLRIRAVTAGGPGTSTADFSGTTVPGVPSTLAVTAASITTSSMTLTFSPPVNAASLTGYEYQVNSGSWTALDSDQVTAGEFALSGLSSNVVHTIALRATSAAGKGASTSATGTTLPGAPTSLIVSSVTGDSSRLSVAFTAPTGTATITAYEFSTDGGSTWAAATGTASPITLTGLDANTAYLRLQVRAVNAAGNSEATANLSGTTVAAAPSITGVTAAGTTSLTVDFTAPNAPLNTEPATITNYEYSTDGGTTWRARNTTGTSSPLTITLASATGAALASNTSYSVKIRAVNGGGSGVASGSSSGLTLPGVASSIVASGVTGDTAKLSVSFTAPSGSGTITSYEFSTDGGSNWVSATGATSPITFTGLDANTAYSALQLRAINAAGTGTATTSFSGTTVAAAPSITSVTAASSTSLTVNFSAPNAPLNTSPATITNYEYSTDGGTTWRARNTTGTSSPITITLASATGLALASNTSYNVKIRAVNGGGSGVASATSAGLTLSAAPTSPVASGVTGQPTQLSVAFTAPTGAGTITGYEFSKDGGSTWAAATGTSSPITLTGLTANTTYTTLLQIRAVTAAGSGSASASFTGTTVPAAPTITSITGASTTSLTVNITAPAGASTWQYSTNGTDWKAGTVASGVMTISQTSPAGTTALSVNTAYSVTVRAISAAGTGATSAAVTGTTLPAAPAFTAAPYTGDGTKMTLTLTAPAGSATITGYQYSTNGTNWTAATIVDATTIVIGGLATNTKYSTGTKILLTATNAGGTSASGNVGTSYTTPAAPTLGAATGITASSLSVPVTWVAGGAAYTAPTGYQYSIDGGTTWTSVTSVATSYTLALSGLSSNTTYTLSVRAVSTAGAGSASSTSITTLAGAPTGMVASAVPGASTTLSVSFSPPTGNATATGYQFTTNGSVWSAASGTSSPITITGLTANTTYATLAIRVVTAAGSGASSTTFSGTTALGAPTALSVSGNTKNSFSVSFTAPAGTVTGYDVSTDAGTTWVDAGTTTSPISVTGLTSNTTYDVKVRAKSAAGAGDASATVSGTTLAGAPTINTVSSVNGDGSKLLVSFTPPQGEATSVGVRAAVITGYEFSLNGSTWTAATSVTSTSVYVTGLTPNTEYTTLQLRAVNAAGGGIGSAYFGGTTVLGAPTIGSVTAVSTTELSVTLSAAASGAETVQNFEYSTNGGISFTAVSPASTSTTVTIAGLTANTAYSVVVRAVNSNGSGTPSASVSGTTMPGAPTLLTVSPVSGDGSKLSVAFTAPTGSATITVYQYRLDGGTWAAATGTTSPIVISGLVDNTTYGVELRATNAGGTGAESNSVSGTTSLAQPTITGFASSTTTSLDISFTAPAAGTVNNYQYSTDGGVTWTTRSPAGTTSPLSITGLAANTVYSVKVRAVDGNGVAGSPSAAFPSTTLVGTATIGAITGASTTSLSVPFTAPTGTGTISNYEYSTDGGTTWRARNTTGNTSPLTITVTSATGDPLTANTAYSVRIRAINAAGTGAASTAASGTTLADAPTLTAYSATVAKSVTMTLTPPGGSATVTGYEYTINGGTTFSAATMTGFTFPIGSLADNTNYSVQVRAVNAGGKGTWSSAFNATTLAAAIAGGLLAPVAGDGTKMRFTFTTPPTGNATILGYNLSRDNKSTWDAPLYTVTYDAAAAIYWFEVTGLIPNTAYSKWVIRAVNAAGTSLSASAQESGTTVPNAPTISSVTSTNSTSVAINYTAPSTGGAATLTNYEYSFDGFTTFVARGSNATTAWAITGLTPNTTYNLQMRAVNAGGKGSATSVTSFTTVPAAPTAFTASGVAGDPTKLSVAFTNPSGTITSYQYSTDGGTNWTTAAETSSPLTITGLTANTVYSNLKLRAVAAGGNGDATAAFSGTTVPAAPGISSVASTNSTTVSVTFTAPATGGAATLTNYEYSLDGFTTFVARGSIATPLTWSIGSLAPNTTYSLQMRAVNAGGKGVATSVTSFTTMPAAPTSPVASAVTGEPTKLSVAFTKPSGTITGYQYSIDGGTNWTTAVETSSPVVITGLTSNTTYANLKLRAVAAGGNGDATAAFSGTTVPAAASLSAATLGETSVRITATPPSGTITGYQYSTDNGSNWSSTVTSPFTITGLSANTDYTVQVKAISGASLAGVITSVAVSTIAGAPVAGTVASPGTSSFAVPFTLPVGGNSSITNIEYSIDGGTTWTTRSPASTASPVTITGLSSNTTYSVKVRAVNAAGSGTASGSTSGTTLPAAPTSVSAAAVNGDSSKLTVSFTAPSGPVTISGYEYRLDANSNWTSVSLLTATTFRIAGLSHDTSYPAVQVRAINGAGAGPASANATGVTVPTSPSISSVTRGNASVTVDYAAPATNGGSAIASYLVYAYTDAAGTTMATGVTNPQTDSTVDGCTTTVSSCSYSFTGLSNGTTYWFRVVATSGAGNGEVSAVSSGAKAATVPDATAVTDLNPGNTTIEVHWSTPAFNGGEPIDHFDVYAYTDEAGTVLAAVTGSNTNPQQVSGAGTVKAIFRGLTNLTGYTFRVVAHNAVGDSAPSAASAVATPLPVSDPPTGVSGLPGNGQVTVSWNPPVNQGVSALTAYKVFVYSDAETLVQVGSVHTVTGSPLPTNYTVTGLDNGSPYWFEVAAVNEQGTSMNSDESSSVTPRTVPDVPTGVSGLQGVGTITVSWTPPVWNGGSPITAYRLFTYSNAEGTTQVGSTAVLTGTPVPTTKTVTGLTNGASYWFKVVAVNAAGDSVATALSDPYEPFALPLAPTIGSPTSGNTAVSAAWTALTPTTARPVEGYRVYVYTNSGGSTLATGITNPVEVSGASTTSTSITGLTNGTSYWLRVAGFNDAGEGAKSGVSAAVVPSTVPNAPTIGSPTAGNAQATVRWTAPASNGGAAISKWYVYIYTDADATTLATGLTNPQSFTGAATTSGAVTGLTNGTTYWFAVSAENVKGEGAKSAASAATTARTVPNAPTAVTGDVALNSVTVSWTAPQWDGGSAITAYRVFTYSNAEGTTQVGVTAVVTGTPVPTSKTVTGLTGTSSYWFKVVAVNVAGDSVASSLSGPYEPYALPLAPTIGSPTSGNTSVTAAWTALTPTTARPVDGYRVYVYTNSGGSTLATGITNPVEVTGSSSTSVSVTGLTNGTSYWLRVAGYSSVGEGAKSGVSAAVVPSTVPNAPTIGSPTAGIGQATVRWTAPASNGGAAISKWNVYIYTDADATTVATGLTNPQSFTGPTTTSGIVTDLANGATYWFQVAAENVKGEGAKSATSAGVTARTVPEAPTLDSVVRGDRQLTLTVTPNGDGGSPITGYQYSTNGGTSWSNLTGSSPFAIINQSGGTTRLVNGTTYSVTVRAVNVAGASAASSAGSGTPATTPGAPTAVVATRGNEQLDLVWEAPTVDGGSTVNNYRVTVYAADGTTVATGVTSTSRTVGSNATSYTFTGLANGVPYRFKVEAGNDVGWGTTASAASVGVVPNADNPPLNMSSAPAAVGVSQDIDITITGTNLKAGATVTGDDKVTVSNVSSPTDGSITLTIAGVTAGTGRLSVVNPDHGIGWLDVTVTPVLASLAIATGPAAIAQGATRSSIAIGGTGLQAGATLGSLPTGVTVSGTPTTVTNGRMTVTLVAAADAPLGAGTITLTNPDGGSITFPITVNPPPTITALSPSIFAAGASSTPTTLTGTNIFLSTEITAYPKVTPAVGSLTFPRAQYVNSTSLALTVSVTSDAQAATWVVQVTNADGGTGTFEVSVWSAPSITSAVDNASLTTPQSSTLTRPASSYRDYVVKVTGLWFQKGATFAVSGTGVTVYAPVWTIDLATGVATLKAKVRVTSTATVGDRDVTVTNPDRTTAVKVAALTIASP